MRNPAAVPPAIPGHELLACIGAGSYGEVWLARNVTGAGRAIKIIHRATFSDARPYEREFAGLKCFEPVSREHEGLVDVLQIGRDDDLGFFYYVMELADDAISELGTRNSAPTPAQSPSSNSENQQSAIGHRQAYTPLTLESRIRAHGRLAVKDCVAVGKAVAAALTHLHTRALVHRDIKPSNIIFVGGVPKLADIGLVARADAARTFVGTEGFIPPEGPGTPQADLYSLGKCLYEMAMGKDRQAFPSAPTLIDEFPDRAELLELNQVIARACDPEPARRYRSGAELAADLELVESGKSVRAARRQRSLRKAALLVASGVGLAALFWFGSWLSRKPHLALVKSFALPNNWPARHALLGHYFSRTNSELFLALPGSFAVTTLDGVGLPGTSGVGRGSELFDLHFLADTDGNGRDEMFVSWRDSTNLLLNVFNQNFAAVATFRAIGSLTNDEKGALPISRLDALQFLPGSPELPARLLAGLYTGTTPPSPRSVRLYDYASGALIWDAPFPSNPGHHVEVLSIASNRVFILGTQSHNNHAKAPDGTDDEHSYVYALSEATGDRLWTFEAGPDHTEASPRLLPQPGRRFVIAAVWKQYESWLESGGTNNAWRPYLVKLDALTGAESARIVPSHPVISFAVASFPGKPNPLILAACADGFLLAYDTDLNLLKEIRLVPGDGSGDWSLLHLRGVHDLDGDGRVEVLLSSSRERFVSGTNTLHPRGDTNRREFRDNTILVLDDGLHLLTRHVVPIQSPYEPFKVLLATNASGGTSRIVSLDQDATVFQFRRR